MVEKNAASDSGVVQDDGKESISSDDDILRRSREGLKLRIEDEDEQRKLMLDDLRFAALDQWPDDIRAMRENDVVNGKRPCLTIDQINQYITQVSNDMRKNRPSIKTRPVDDVADPETAKIFQGLIRHIEDQSSAQIAYATAGESAATIGMGFFRIVSEYVSPDSFDQELRIKRVPDSFSVYLGKHIMPDGSDCEEAWIFETMPMAEFKREYPKALYTQPDFEGLEILPTWRTDDSIIVCEYYRKKYEKKMLFFLENGETTWEDEYDEMDEPRPAVVLKRKSDRCSIEWIKHTGCEVLEKRELPGDYIPVVEVIGKEKFVEGRRVLWGLVRPAKDSLRAFNYWISAMTEKMALAPKAPFIGAVGQFSTMEEQWNQANTVNFSRLEYDPIEVNGNMVPAPRRQEPITMEPAMAQMLQIMQNNVKSSLGMYKAALGETESQQSGRAILALQRESDTGTMHFGENQALAITHAGRILVNLIPHYYDTKRVIRILGEDGTAETARIDPEQKDPIREITKADGSIQRIYNLNVGRYDVTVSVGPSYSTSRQEAATVMTDLANTAKDPISAAILRYGAIKNSDFSGSEELVEMLKKTLPPQVLAGDKDAPQIPPQLQQQMQMMQDGLQKLTQENQALKQGTAEAMAKVQADQQAAAAKLQAEQEQFIKDQQLQVWKAELEANTKLRIAGINSKTAVHTAYLTQQAKDEVDLNSPEGEETELPEGDVEMEMPVRPMDRLMQNQSEGVAQIVAALSEMSQFNQQALTMIAQGIQAAAQPKVVRLGNIQRDTNGQIINASAISGPQQGLQ